MKIPGHTQLALAAASVIGAAVHYALTKEDKLNSTKNKTIENALVSFAAMNLWLNSASGTTLSLLPKVVGTLSVGIATMAPVAHHSAVAEIRQARAAQKTETAQTICTNCKSTIAS